MKAPGKLLERYNEKRDFERTSEPRPKVTAKKSLNRFVVQEHHASRLHWDFRLEMDGVLKSWAVPKGPSTDPKVKRLAIMVEDHPVGYIDFSGTIPEGNYGAGTVSIWDSGTYEPLETDNPGEAIAKGKLLFQLNGARLNGVFDLFKTDGKEENQWLLVKSTRGMSESVTPKPNGAVKEVSAIPGAKPAKFPGDLKPMLAEMVDNPPGPDCDWEFELKWDGYRALAYIRNGGSSLVSRNLKSFDKDFSEISNLAKWFTCREAVLDGEIVALDAGGHPHFQTLQNRTKFRGGKPTESDNQMTIAYMVFDLIYCDGFDITQAPLSARRELLQSILLPGGPVRFSEGIDCDGPGLFEQAAANGLEGIMAKRRNGRYLFRRSSDWLKIKTHQTMDAVICGYTKTTAAGRPFGALALGAYDGDRLVYIGNVGTGFNRKNMAELMALLKPLVVESSPFVSTPNVPKGTIWVKPEQVCEVKFAEVTQGGLLRQPVFLHVRIDKDPRECLIMKPASPEAEAKSPKNSGAIGPLKDHLTDDTVDITVDGHKLHLTNLTKVYWPETGTTKGDLIRYYADTAATMLPYLADRPLVLQRYPNGVKGQSFFQHNIEKQPDFLKTFAIEESKGTVHYAICDESADLLYLANLGAIPIHGWNSRTASLDHPDWIIFDLDPQDEFSACIDVALELRKFLEAGGLQSYVKTSGSNGLHIYVPIVAAYTEDKVKEVAKLTALNIQQHMPDRVTVERMVKNRRAGQVYLDYGQNGRGKTVVAPYSVRPSRKPLVSTPLKWDEVNTSLDPTRWDIDTVRTRLAEFGDLFGPVLHSPQRLPG